MTVLTGRFSVDGQPVAAAEVLAFDGDPRRLRTTVITGENGVFELPALHDARPALLARQRGTVLALAGAELEPGAGGPMTLDAAGPLCRLTITLQSDAGYPDELQIYLDPVSVQPLPERLLPFVKQLEPGVMSARFWEQMISERTLDLRVQAGVWKIGGAFVVHERADMLDPDFRNYVVNRALATPQGSELPGSASTGFQIDLREDREVVLELREVSDDEL